MRSNFPFSLRGIDLLENGRPGILPGVSLTPGDRGGLTSCQFGIVNATFQEFLQKNGLPSIPLASMTPEQAQEIMDQGYWTPCGADEMPIGLDFAVFQEAVNSGPGRAVKILQQVFGLQDDGVLGPQTLKSIQALETPSAVIDACAIFFGKQRDFYNAIVEHDPNQKEFLNGWNNRTIRAMDIIMGRALSC